MTQSANPNAPTPTQPNTLADNNQPDEEMQSERGNASDQEMPTDDDNVSQNEVLSESSGRTFVPNDDLTDDNDSNEDNIGDDGFELPNEVEVKEAVKELAKTLKITGLFEQFPFDDLADQTKLKKARAVNKMFRAIYKVVSPSNPIALKSFVETKFVIPPVVPDNFMNGVLSTVARNYEEAPNAQMRRAALSFISPFMKFAQVQKFIPNLSERSFKASKYVLSIDQHIQKDGWIQRKTRFSMEAVTNFIQFICAPEFVIDLPFGSDTLKLSNNETIDVQKVIRTQCQSEIIRLYRSSIAQSGENFLALSTSTCVRILDVLPMKSSKSMQCIDYFISDGETGNILKCLKFI